MNTKDARQETKDRYSQTKTQAEASAELASSDSAIWPKKLSENNKTSIGFAWID